LWFEPPRVPCLYRSPPSRATGRRQRNIPLPAGAADPNPCPPAARTEELKIDGGPRIIKLLVPLSFRSLLRRLRTWEALAFCLRLPQKSGVPLGPRDRA
jgi:hypothetical protein